MIWMQRIFFVLYQVDILVKGRFLIRFWNVQELFRRLTWSVIPLAIGRMIESAVSEAILDRRNSVFLS